MKNFAIQVNVPDEALFALGFSQDETSRRMLELLAVDLYNQGRLSGVKAAAVLGVEKYDFIKILGEQGKAFFRYSTEELAEVFEMSSTHWEKV